MTEAAHKAGFAAVIGAPNAGKSTLVNRLVGTKVSIVTKNRRTLAVRPGLDGNWSEALAAFDDYLDCGRRLTVQVSPTRQLESTANGAATETAIQNYADTMAKAQNIQNKLDDIPDGPDLPDLGVEVPIP